MSGGGSAGTRACRGTSHCRKRSPIPASPLFWWTSSREGERRCRKGEAWQWDREWRGWPVRAVCLFHINFMCIAKSKDTYCTCTPFSICIKNSYVFFQVNLHSNFLCTHTYSKRVWYFLYPHANFGQKSSMPEQSRWEQKHSISGLYHYMKGIGQAVIYWKEWAICWIHRFISWEMNYLGSVIWKPCNCKVNITWCKVQNYLLLKYQRGKS